MAEATFKIRVVGISGSTRAEPLRERIRRNLEEALRFLEEKCAVPHSLSEVHDGHVGPGYALPTAEMREAVELLARMEGILLDPVHTGKAMAGLLDLVRGAFPPCLPTPRPRASTLPPEPQTGVL